jgi:hypothetical protein
MPEWVDEIPRTKQWPNQKYDWDDIAKFLRKKPGKWARVARDVPRSHAYAIRQGLKRAFQPPDEWMTRTVVDPENRTSTSRADLYMAFVGAPGARLRATRQREGLPDESG